MIDIYTYRGSSLPDKISSTELYRLRNFALSGKKVMEWALKLPICRLISILGHLLITNSVKRSGKKVMERESIISILPPYFCSWPLVDHTLCNWSLTIVSFNWYWSIWPRHTRAKKKGCRLTFVNFWQSNMSTVDIGWKRGTLLRGNVSAVA